MPRTHGPITSFVIETVVMDKAPGPVVMAQPTAGATSIPIDPMLPTTDFDGSALTGLDELHIASAQFVDGVDTGANLSAEELLSGPFWTKSQPVTPSQAGQVVHDEVPVLSGGAGSSQWIRVWVSDGQV